MNILGIKSARFNRLTYFLSIFFALFVFGGIGTTLGLILNFNAGNSSPNPFIFIPFAIGFYAYVILAMVKRLHDLNINGLWSIAYTALAFVPFVNLIAGSYLLFQKGTAGNNNYGSQPKVIHIMGIEIWHI
jgi:uncharacterized membrane protein YhaH (DUF805 family)